MYIEHGIKLFEIMAGVRQYDLENDEDIKAVKFSGQQAREKIVEEEKKKMQLQGEDAETVKKACEELGEIDLSTDLTGTISFESYLKIFELIVKLQVGILHDIEQKAKEERRPFLENGDQQKYATTCMTMLA